MGLAEDAALARYLQQQETGYSDAADLSNDSNTSSDGNWSSSEQKGRPKRLPRKTSKKAMKADVKGNSKVADQAPAARRSGRRSEQGGVPKKKGKTPVKWADTEHARFVEGLELHGRNWEELARYIGSERDKHSVKSHAQKYFVKLHLEGKPLPEKVKETGEGFTLSGKPLDPDSATVKAYSNGAAYRRQIQERRAKNTEDGSPENSNGQTQPDIEAEQQIVASDQLSKVNGKDKRSRAVTQDSTASESVVATGGAERSEYATKRLRHKQIGPAYVNSHGENDFSMVPCERYSTATDSSRGAVQPFEVAVDGIALAIMDFHAHMAVSEIIGFLGGTWDPKAKVLHVKNTFPCRELFLDESEENYEVSVELSPESEIEVREKIASQSLQIVGWYHSHPTFKPIPSNRDVANQHNYQVLFKDAAHDLSPFVGAIVGPYDVAMPSESSVINWFHIRRPPSASTPAEARALDVKVVHSVPGAPVDTLDMAIEEMRNLAKHYKDSAHRIGSLQAVWRDSTATPSDNQLTPENSKDSTEQQPGKAVQGPGRTVYEKLCLSITQRLADDEGRQRLLDEVLSYTLALWEG